MAAALPLREATFDQLGQMREGLRQPEHNERIVEHDRIGGEAGLGEHFQIVDHAPQFELVRSGEQRAPAVKLRRRDGGQARADSIRDASRRDDAVHEIARKLEALRQDLRSHAAVL